MKSIINIFFLFALNYINYSESFSIDTVISYNFGTNTQYGQNSEFFPKNIFKIPPKEAGKNAPASSEEDICSLGLNGEIIVGFKNKIILDNDGNDFVIFENVFINPVNKKPFVEPGIVSVSKDGINYIEFPFDTTELTGCAGINYTIGSSNIFIKELCGGDQFDIAKLGLKYIKYIKIKDFTEYLLNHTNHKYYDPIINGFDLDNVIGFNIIDESMSAENEKKEMIIENNDFIIFNEFSYQTKSLFDITGNLIFQTNENIIYKQNLNSGVYLMKFRDKFYKFIKY